MIPLLNTYKELDRWAGKIRDLYRARNLEDGYNPSHELQNITYDIETNMGVFTMVFHVPDYFKWAENGREGTQGSHNWEELMEDIRSQLTEDIKKALEKDFMEYIKGIGDTVKKR